jgi:hypothetical protein
MIKNSSAVSAIISIFLLSSGCGSNQPSDDGAKNPNDKTGNGREPLTLTYDNEVKTLDLGDANCTEELALADIGELNVWQWNGQKVIQVRQDFSGVSGQGLASEFQSSASYGYHEIEHFECKGGCTANSYEKGVVHPAQILRICKADIGEKRDSIESAAISMFLGARGAFQYYRTLRNASSELPQMSFNILPIYESIYHHSETAEKKIENRSHTATDNAYWKLGRSIDNNYRQTIEVLPHSKEIGNLALTGEDVRFWEISMVLGHEFGHHVFFAHAPNLVATASAKFVDHELWSEGSRQTHSGQEFVSKPLNVATDFAPKNAELAVVLMPILESFADLFGQYSQDQAEPFKNIRCLGVNRDLAIDHFGDIAETAKILTSGSVSHFAVSSGRESFADCNTPSAGNYYSVASVLAYGINALFEAAAGQYTDGAGAKAERGTVLLEWITALNRELPTFDKKNSKNYLSYALDRLISASVGERAISTGYCEVLQRVFPFYLENIPEDTQVSLGDCKAVLGFNLSSKSIVP